MAIAVRDTDSDNSAAATDVTLNGWSGVAEDDLLLCLCQAQNTGDEWGDEASWTKVLLGSGMGFMALYYRLAPAAFTTVTFDYGTSTFIGAVGIALSGCDTTNPISSIGPQYSDTPSTAPINVAAVSQAQNSWSVVFCSIDDTVLNTNPEPSGYTLDERLVTNVGIAVAHKAHGTTVPTAEAPGNWLLDSSQEWLTCHIMVIESGAAWGGGGGGGGSVNPTAGPIGRPL